MAGPAAAPASMPSRARILRGKRGRMRRLSCTAGLPDATGSFHCEGRGWCGRRGAGDANAGAGDASASAGASSTGRAQRALDAYRQSAVGCRLDYLAMSRLSYSMYATAEIAAPSTDSEAELQPAGATPHVESRGGDTRAGTAGGAETLVEPREEEEEEEGERANQRIMGQDTDELLRQQPAEDAGTRASISASLPASPTEASSAAVRYADVNGGDRTVGVVVGAATVGIMCYALFLSTPKTARIVNEQSEPSVPTASTLLRRAGTFPSSSGRDGGERLVSSDDETVPEAMSDERPFSVVIDLLNGKSDGGMVRGVLVVSMVIAALASAFLGKDAMAPKRGGGRKSAGDFDVEAQRRALQRTLELDFPSTTEKPTAVDVGSTRSGVRDASSGKIKVATGSACTPHPMKVDKGGEDANFILSPSNVGGGVRATRIVMSVVGVADGVSGWADDGIDAGKYSKKLMANAKSAAMAMTRELIQPSEARTALEASSTRAVAGMAGKDSISLLSLVRAQDQTREEGSCCALLYAVISDTRSGAKTLDVASVGDCGIRVIRGSSVVYANQVQEHDFNQPYQLASVDFLPTCDVANSCAMTESVSLQPGDVIVAGSDGLFDNMYDQDIVSVVAGYSSRSVRNDALAKEAASLLVDIAAKHSVDTKYRSPWSSEVTRLGLGLPLWRRALGQEYTGGKADDITCVVSFV